MTETTRTHRCADHADYIGGYPPYECLVCGKRLYADEVTDEGSEHLICTYCSAECATPEALAAHGISAHGGPLVAGGEQ